MKKTVILLATYNGEKFLPALLDSLLYQTVPSEIVVSDDGSTDGTGEILRAYAEKMPLTILPNKRCGGAKENFMRLLQDAPEAAYYLFCDQDDVWHPEKTEKTLLKMQEIEQAGRPALVHGDLTVTDENLRVLAPSLFDYQKLSPEQTPWQSLIQNNVTGCTVMINGALRQMALRAGEADGMIMHDWLLNLLASFCGTVGFINEPLIDYRQHGGNEVGAKNVGSLPYLAGKMKNGRKNRESLRATQRQAALLAERYREELGENFKGVKAYAEADTKIKRLRVCRQYGIWKNTLVRKIGQIVYM